MASVEELAEKQLAEMDEKKAKQLTTPLRSAWSRAQTITMKVDKITGVEMDLVASDRELQKLALEKRIIEARIQERITKILKNKRVLPYQVSEKGVLIELDNYNLPGVRVACGTQDLIFEEDTFTGVGYIRPNSKRTAESAMPVIKPILENNFKLNDGGNLDGN